MAHSFFTSLRLKLWSGNIIAALNTGSGKTLISLLLIKWTIAKERSKGKVIIFLVPKVTLVEQQSLYIDKNTPDSIRVMKIHGALDINLGDRAGWKKRFEGHEVFVMTGSLLFALFIERRPHMTLHSSDLPQYIDTFSVEY